ncbi:23S rRNA (uridine(2552)-2'-O)-methyltransferase RlmE [Thiofilum flexile]|uniref:23S rRNA (uridine(2552)-2'-O)-methyltransferase RlmE n=1 Tax=Thiofilum flexile TaxID=125627 RepID=UPI0003807AB2|nr:23S rRNA (uridine(2552)-2'-O)-methyltransferase RlmE [Thiofilum flexile]
MARSKSSQRWLSEHFSDPYVKKSQQEGYRSRAVYKLKEIQTKDRLIRAGDKVIDLGAAPGGWSQYVAEIVGEKGKIVASDILPIDPLAFVEFIQGDFREESVLDEILQVLGSDQVDLVISDMAPNVSGMEAVDQPRAIHLCELALDLACKVLRPGGHFLVKMFQGEGSEQFLKEVRTHFKDVKIRKPSASRPRSREVYVLAQRFVV